MAENSIDKKIGKIFLILICISSVFISGCVNQEMIAIKERCLAHEVISLSETLNHLCYYPEFGKITYDINNIGTEQVKSIRINYEAENGKFESTVFYRLNPHRTVKIVQFYDFNKYGLIKKITITPRMYMEGAIEEEKYLLDCDFIAKKYTVFKRCFEDTGDYKGDNVLILNQTIQVSD